jgi:serine/threonine protein phosphatase PrpC
MRKENAKVRTHFISKAGQALLNRDFFAFVELGNFACYVLADGIDEDLDESAKTVVMETLRLFSDTPSMKAGRLRKILEKVNDFLIKNAGNVSPEASVMLLVTDYRKYRYAQAGNVRLCGIRNGTVRHESRDMSLTVALSAKGEISEDKVAEHVERHNLSAFMGQRSHKFLPYVSGKLKLEDGDALALYSRGVWEKASTADILEAANGVETPEDWANTVEEIVRAPSEKPIENYTFVAIFVDKAYENAENRKSLVKKILMIGIPVFVILLAVGITLFVRYHMRQADLSEMNNAWEDAKVAAEIGNFARAAERAEEAYAISQKLSLAEEHDELMNLTVLLAHITAGNEAFLDKRYDDALLEFRAADKKSHDTDLLAADYIAAKLNTSADYADVLDLLNRGDEALDGEDYEAAKDFFLQAKTLAYALRATDEKSLARDGLSRARAAENEKNTAELKDRAALYEKLGDEYPETSEEQYRLSAETYRQSGDTVAEALVLEKLNKLTEDRQTEEDLIAIAQAQSEEMNGDLAYEAGDFALARSLYLSAQALYTKQGLVDLSQNVGQKLLLVFQAGQDGTKERARADAYMADGDGSFVKGETQAARLLYQMAYDIYEEMGLLEEMDKARSKIDQADKRLESAQ